jgi:hypothetical protein
MMWDWSLIDSALWTSANRVACRVADSGLGPARWMSRTSSSATHRPISTLKGMGALAEDPNVDEARTAHYRKYRILRRTRLHWLWTGLHLAVAGYGIAICTVVLTR